MTEASLAGNRRNARKSTGPRSTAGKLRAASNALQHGLSSLRNFEHFIHDDDIALTYQLIHQQLRFLQMEYLFHQAMSFRVIEILAKPVTRLPAILRELDRFPSRIERSLKLLRCAHPGRPHP